MISSAQNPKIKLARALTERLKDRREEGAFPAEGVRLVEEALAAHWPIRFVLYSEELSKRGLGLIKELEDTGVEAEAVDGRLFRALCETQTPQGILAILDDSQIPSPSAPDFVLIPDSIRDPGNLGTLLRSADAAGVQLVLRPPETTDPFAPKVLRAGMGAHFRLPIQSMSWDEIREFVGRAGEGGLQVYLADMNGTSCWASDFRRPLALVIGGEAEGASHEARQLAQGSVNIPMAGKTESLNAAVAGSILMFEVMRQRNSKRSGDEL
jgi:RNA methyltransferase, TrmH family